MKRLVAITVPLLLCIPLLTQAGKFDADFGQIQTAGWEGNIALLQSLSQSLAKTAENGDAEAAYAAAYADYRIAGAGQRDIEKNRTVIDQALSRAQSRLEALSNLGTPYQAESLALLSSVYGMEIAMDTSKSATLGYRAGKAIAQAEKMAPDNPRVQLMKGINKLYTPPLYGGSRDEAMNAFDRAISALPPASFSAVNWGLDDAYIWRGMAYQHAGAAEQARASFKQALAVAPQHRWAAALVDRAASR